MKKYAVAVLVLSLSSMACSAQSSGSQTVRFKVAVLSYVHETCTFCPGGDVEVADWLKAGDLLSPEAVIERSGSFARQAREYGDIELIGLTSPSRVYGGSSRSWNSEASFEEFTGTMLDELRAAMPVDGVFLNLHGALAVRNVPRPEAEIAKRVREVVGDGVPIVGRFDLHGNEDEEFLRWADGSFVTKRYPHYDWDLQGERAARYMRRIMIGEWTPTTATRKPPVLTGTVLLSTITL